MPSPELDGCTTDYVSPLVGFLVLAEFCIGAVSIILNCALAVCSYHAVPFSFSQRQSLGAISLNYVLVSGVILARSIFVGFIAYSTCNTTVTTANCKIQEFPLVFVYFQAAFMPALLAVQFFYKQK
uniref:G protein-coupled receptor n=1 Tax=Bursaphelenchus xylophilus TaxID=6326 RepID=A0A1I7S9J1_BURXY